MESVSTDVNTRRVEVVGTADASTLATTIGINTKRSVKVISDLQGTGFPGYKHEPSKKAATTTHKAEQETVATATEDGSASPVLTPIRLDPRLRIVEPPPAPPPLTQAYGAAASEAAYYLGPGGWYNVQNWTAPEPTPYPAPSGYYYDPRHGEVYGTVQDWWSTSYTTSWSYNESDYGPPGECVRAQSQQNDDDNAGSKCTIQ